MEHILEITDLDLSSEELELGVEELPGEVAGTSCIGTTTTFGTLGGTASSVSSFGSWG